MSQRNENAELDGYNTNIKDKVQAARENNNLDTQQQPNDSKSPVTTTNTTVNYSIALLELQVRARWISK